MSMILGMGLWVFIAWIGTIIAAIFCIIYGIYNKFFVNEDEGEMKKKSPVEKNKVTKKKGVK